MERRFFDQSMKNVLKKVKHALWRQFEGCSSHAVDEQGYVLSRTHNLLAGVRMEDFETELADGAGGELVATTHAKPKFHAVHSSAALTVNCFAPFKRNLQDLSILGEAGFEHLEFERKFNTGLRSPAHLDVVVTNARSIICLETKFTETFTKHTANFGVSYKKRHERWCSVWVAQMESLQAHSQYEYLDAAQVVKHALGIGRSSQKIKPKLFYLYWHPVDAEQCEYCANQHVKHQKEIKEFARAVAGATPSFYAMSYHELWAEWERNNPPAWLKSHIKNLRARYDVKLCG